MTKPFNQIQSNSIKFNTNISSTCLIYSYNISVKCIMQITADQLGTLITLSAAATGSIIVILVNCITHSRCTDISCCWKLFHCIRQLPEPEPYDEPVLHEP